MDQEEKDDGAIAALMIRFTESRLPRAQRMLDDMKAGEKLTQVDIDYLERIYEEGKMNRSLWARNPEYDEIIVKFTDLYLEIVRRGIENEKNS